MKKILIIEDEKEIRNILRVYLNACGYEVEEAEDGEEGINLFYAKTFDLVLLDVMLPKKDGWSICREIKQYSSVPVIIMTARADENDEVFGLELGADDYITKPFSNKVLVARIKTILKNRENRKEDILKIGNIEINDISHTVSVNGRKVELAPKEYEILMYMIKNSNIALRREKMLVEIWGYDFSYEHEFFNLKRDKFIFNKFFQKILSKYLLDIEEKNITLKIDIEDAELEGDLKKLDVVINNLLTNAITYIDNRGIINITLKNSIFIIENSSEPISKDNLENIFKPFYKLDFSRKRKYGGTGLGLAIVKNILDFLHILYKVDYDEERGFFVFQIEFK